MRRILTFFPNASNLIYTQSTDLAREFCFLKESEASEPLGERGPGLGSLGVRRGESRIKTPTRLKSGSLCPFLQKQNPGRTWNLLLVGCAHPSMEGTVHPSIEGTLHPSTP